MQCCQKPAEQLPVVGPHILSELLSKLAPARQAPSPMGASSGWYLLAAKLLVATCWVHNL